MVLSADVKAFVTTVSAATCALETTTSAAMYAVVVAAI